MADRQKSICSTCGQSIVYHDSKNKWQSTQGDSYCDNASNFNDGYPHRRHKPSDPH